MHALDTLSQVWGLIADWFTYATYYYLAVVGALIAIGIFLDLNK